MRAQKTKGVTLVGLFALFLMIVITAILLFSNGKMKALAMEQGATVENNTASYFAEGEEYDDGKIIIVVSKEETRRFRSYTPMDFPELTA